MKNILIKTITLCLLVTTLTLSGCSTKEESKDSFGPYVRPDDFIFPEYEDSLTIPKEENLVIPPFTFGANYTTYLYRNSENLSIDKYKFEDSNIYKSYTWNRTNFGYGVTENTIFLYEHLIVLPTSGTYEFFVKAQGDVRVYVSTNYEDYHLVVNNNFTDFTYDYYNTNTFFKLSLEENQPISIKVMLNTSVRADFAIGLTNNIGIITNISDSYVALFD